MIRRVLVLLSILGTLFFSKEALASHFRYGTVNWTVPNPQAAPNTVQFTVTIAWRADFLPVDSTTLNFGDGANNGQQVGTLIGSGTDSGGLQYTVYEYSATHLYAAAGNYTAFIDNCCRIAGLVNGAGGNYHLSTLVALGGGNTAGPVSASPAIIQLQAGNVRTYTWPMFDPDGDVVACRLATQAEVGFANPTPAVPNGGAIPVLTTVAAGCQLTWDLTSALVGQKFVVHIMLESTHAGAISNAPLDLLVEIITPPPPTCAGSGTFFVNVGQMFSAPTTGTTNVAGNLNTSTINAPASSTLTPAAGGPSPLTKTFSWTPSLADAGTTQIVVVNYTNMLNHTGTCFLSIQVPQCANYGQACSAGVGECQKAGSNVCAGPGLTVCNAVPGVAQPEVCDNKDNDCDGVTDDGNPGSGIACATALPGVCTAGSTTCAAGGMIQCVPTIAPGAQTETCDGLDNDCDGTSDEGFNLGSACTNGVGACQTPGVIVCGVGGSASCNAVPGVPQPESCDNADNDCDGVTDDGNPGSGIACATGLPGACAAGSTTCAAGGMIQCVPGVLPGAQTETCDGLDNDCDGVSDDGFNLGAACTNGTGECQANGLLICNAGGGASCTAVPTLPAPEVCGDGLDNDCDGAVENGCLDSDGDGLFDDEEVAIGTDPLDADSDDDGVSDGEEPSLAEDGDGDGLINALDPDSDDDGLFDGTELGLGCGDAATDLAAEHCTPDADMGATVTDPLDPDSDHGGVGDGGEDANLNGAIDPGETDPTAGHGADDGSNANLDSDGDGLPDALELLIGTNPNDADSDDDGVLDGAEPNYNQDSDGDGLINALDPDSDNDGLFDGTELGLDCSNPATNAAGGHCTPDGDNGATVTSPLDADSDDGGVIDGVEDVNQDGVVDPGETDPTVGHGADDSLSINLDSDGDGLSDTLELVLGTDPLDADSDDDGVADGAEPNYNQDSDGDGLINALDADSDNDGLFDGTELGLDCSDPATDPSMMSCLPDGDAGGTTTSPLLADSDGGGVIDGEEDTNHDGALDPGETDPTEGHGGDDPDCTDDSQCGDATSGKVCDLETHACVDGCHTPGNGCPEGQDCSSDTEQIGLCSDIVVGCTEDAQCGDATSGKVCNAASGECVDGCHLDGNGCPDGKVCEALNNALIGTCVVPEPEPEGVIAQGNGLLCSVRPSNDNQSSLAWLFPLALGGLFLARRRRG